MKTTTRFLLPCAACALLACAGGKPEAEVPAPEPPEPPPVDAIAPPTAAEILDAAIEAAGGLEKIEAASSWVSRSKGVYMGLPYESRNTYKDGLVRMEITMAGEQTTMVMGDDPCWMTSGPVILPCSTEDRAINRAMGAMGEATRLAPLKRPGWEMTARRTDVDGRSCDVFDVRNATAGAEGVLILDAETHVVVRSMYMATMHGREAEVVVVPSENKELCGVQMPSKIVTTFGGTPWVEEELLELSCGPVDDAAFAEPPQVADGTVVVRDAPVAVVGCVVMQGPYDGMGAAFGKLMGLLGAAGLAPAGHAMAVYTVGPAETKKPEKYVTEVCIPVGVAAPPAPGKPPGELLVKTLPAAKAVSVYGVGPCEKKSPELAKRAMAEAKTRKLKPAGQMRQIFYSDLATTPPEKQVSEMQLPVK